MTDAESILETYRKLGTWPGYPRGLVKRLAEAREAERALAAILTAAQKTGTTPSASHLSTPGQNDSTILLSS